MAYTFLILDVSATGRALLKRTLRQGELGAGRVLEAASGYELLDMLAHHSVDLILADPKLIDMDGIELLGRILAEPDTRLIPIVALWSRPDPRKAEQLKRYGVRAQLRKPIALDLLRPIISEILEPTHA